MLSTLLLIAVCAGPQELELGARDVTLGVPLGLALARDGSFYVSEREGHRVRRFDLSTGRVTSVAGTGVAGDSGDGGPATDAALRAPDSIATDDDGVLYIADRGNERIRRVDPDTGIITTIAGTGERGVSWDDEPATQSTLCGPYYVRAASDGYLYFTDTDSHRCRRIELASGAIETFAGSGERGDFGDGSHALDASFARPHVVLPRRGGGFLVGDSYNNRIRAIERESGIVSTLAGVGDVGVAFDGQPLAEAPFGFFGEIHELANGDVIFTEYVNARVLRLDLAAGVVRVLAGTTDPEAPRGDGHAPLETNLGRLAGFVVDSAGRFVVVDALGGCVRRIDLEANTVETVIGPEPKRAER